jgi:peptide/nickel transport system substrate-binding protein
MAGYWERLNGAALSRRRVLGGAAGLGLGAAAVGLAGCGGGSNGGSSSGTASQQSSGLLDKPVDSTSRMKPGGTYKSVFISANPPSLDPHTSQGFTTLTAIAAYTYPRIMRFKTAKYPAAAVGEVEGDLAESFEFSGDKLQLTLKLRKGLKWENKAPVNGREIDAQDVLWNWQKFSTVGVRNGDLAYSQANPSSPVESVSAPDNSTVIVKMHAPDASILQLFASLNIFYVIPREAEGGFDSRNTVIGYGPWLLEKYEPSGGIYWRKNPDYYVKGVPVIDRIEQPQVLEYAQRLAQFRAGNIWPTIATQDDVLQLKKDLPQTSIRQNPSFGPTPVFVSFGYEGDSPFKDQRVRQGMALLWDRETFLDTLANRAKFRAAGLEPTTRYNTVVGAGWEGYWIDPQDAKTFGPNARYLTEYNVAEAKKLFSAAGFPNGFSSKMYWPINVYGATFENAASVLTGFWTEGGLKIQSTPLDYQSDYIPNVYYSYQGTSTKGFNGMMWRAELGYPTCVAQMFANLHKDGGRYRGLTPTGTNAKQGDPYLNSTIEKAKQEFDLKKQQELVHDMIRYVAGQAYAIPESWTSTLVFENWWPVTGNLGVYRTANGGNAVVEVYAPTWWIDDTQPPLKG